MVTAMHRLAVWPHMRVSDDNAGHEEPLVAALFNNTFQVVRPSATLPGGTSIVCHILFVSAPTTGSECKPRSQSSVA